MAVMGVFEPLADLLLGACCPGCGAPGLGVCADCLAAVRPAPRVILDGPPPVVACLPYRAPLTSLVTAHKDRGAGWLCDLLGSWLAPGLAAVVEAAGSCPALVPLPSTPAAVRRRGADHVLDLLRAASVRCGLPREAVSPLLRRTRRVRDQVEVSHRERSGNQAGSMSAVRGEGPVVVVDVDEDPQVKARWGDHVPVTFVDGVLIAYWFLDRDTLVSALEDGPTPVPVVP